MRIDPKNSILVDYDGVTDASSFLSIQIYFEASEPFQIEWFLKKVKIDPAIEKSAILLKNPQIDTKTQFIAIDEIIFSIKSSK